MNTNLVFSPSEILIPSFYKDSEKMSKWAVIACDQYTSEPDYWNECQTYIGDAESTLNYIIPEAYLETEKEDKQAEIVNSSMLHFEKSNMSAVNGYIYVERTLPNGETRYGIIGKIDLEEYDYSVGSKSKIRATEKTVVERIPPRQKIRAGAKVEFPHILILTDDKNTLFDYAKEKISTFKPLYDFDLMHNAGHIKGYSIEGTALEGMCNQIADYESSVGELIYAMGDGNHSLAAAKAHWETVKEKTGNLNHPARYALCEITSISDYSLVFEPIYRLLKNCNPSDIIYELKSLSSDNGAQAITVISKEGFNEFKFSQPTHALTVGTLQIFIDEYIKKHPGVICDYIHGESSLIKLSMNENTVGFLFDGMSKGELFPYVLENGTLPRKTFSMGEADTKRFYLEARVITE